MHIIIRLSYVLELEPCIIHNKYVHNAKRWHKIIQGVGHGMVGVVMRHPKIWMPMHVAQTCTHGWYMCKDTLIYRCFFNSERSSMWRMPPKPVVFWHCMAMLVYTGGENEDILENPPSPRNDLVTQLITKSIEMMWLWRHLPPPTITTLCTYEVRTFRWPISRSELAK